MDNVAYRLGRSVIEIIEKKKIVKVEALDVHELTPLADVFIIAIASNVRQTQAIADDVEDFLAAHCSEPIKKEGYATATWILLDCGQIIVHILEEENAAFYGLERLWKDAPSIEEQLKKA